MNEFYELNIVITLNFIYYKEENRQTFLLIFILLIIWHSVNLILAVFRIKLGKKYYNFKKV